MKKDEPTLSFCVTCKNRFHQISQTLRRNLTENEADKERIEFILVDFGSMDGLREWVLSEFRSELQQNYLIYYYTEELPYWHASVAKNTAHRLARHDIVVNLDCDNYTGERGGRHVMDTMLRHGIEQTVLHQFNNQLYEGSYGRIGVTKKNFMAAGGYDESFEPMGYQDGDLIARLNLSGLKRILDSDETYSETIPNSKEESIRHTGSKLSWNEMHYRNLSRSMTNITAGRLVANGGKAVIGIERNLIRCGLG